MSTGSTYTAESSSWTDHKHLPPGKDRKWQERLFDRVKKSTDALNDYRKETRQLIDYMVGRHYNGGSPKKYSSPINPLRLAMQATTMRLGTEVPQCSVSAENTEYANQAYHLQFNTNRQIKSMDYLDEFQERSILEAMIGLSVAKVTCELDEKVVIDGVEVWKKRPVVSLVDSEDCILDIRVKEGRSIRFIGNRYLADVDEVMDNEDYDPRAKEYVKSMRNSVVRGPVPWDQRPLGASNDDEYDREQDLEDQVQLMDVYLPKEKWLLTLVVDAPHIPPLYGRKWYACDPFIPLVFERAPGNVLPVPPARHWVDVARAVDNGYAKLINQFKRQKTVMEVPGGSPEDVARLDATPDGGAYRKDSNGELREVRYGGADQVNFAFAVHIKGIASMVLNNWETLWGSGMAAETATEANILSGGANGNVSSMASRVRKWWGKIFQAMAWFTYHDEMTEPDTEFGNPSLGLSMRVPWSYEQRMQFDFFRFMFDIQPNTMAKLTPDQKVKAIISMLQNIYGPLMQNAMQQGIQVDVAEVMKIAAEESGLDTEIGKILTRVDIPPTQPDIKESGPFKPTNRVYTHESRPARRGAQAQEQALMSNLLSATRKPQMAGAM